MNYHKFSYLASQRRVAAPPPTSPPLPPPTSLPSSSLSSRTCASCADHVTRYPIRVTPSALPLLVYAILYSIEFQAPTGPRALPESSHWHSSSSSHYKNNSSSSSKGHKPHGQLRRSPGRDDDEHVTTRTATAAEGAGSTLSGQVLSAVSSFLARAASAGRASGRCEKTARVGDDDSGRSEGRGSGTSAPGDDDVVQAAAATTSVTRDDEDDDDVDEAVLQRLRAQPCVVPVTQIIHKLGGVYLVVRERHAASVEAAKRRALQDVQAIVEQATARRARQHAHAPQTSASNTTTTTVRDGASVAASARRHGASNDTQSTWSAAPPPQQQQQQQQQQQMWQQRDLTVARASGSRDGGGDDDDSSNNNDNSNDGDTRCRGGSAGATATTAMMTALPTSSSSSSCSARRGGAAAPTAAAEVHVGEGEIGMELTVRLCTRATRWRLSYDERPLAEWCFAMIRTSNEDTIRCGGGNGRTSNSNNNNNNTGSAAAASPAGSGSESVVFVNDAAQIQDVLQFILKTFYEAISIETFADYTAGELVFDARVTERRSFA